MLEVFLMIVLSVLAIFLILVVLVQRGRGGGLAGAFGGAGGQSAFGTKAGDVFTRITITTAFVWIVLCAFTVRVLSHQGDRLSQDVLRGAPASQLPGEKPGGEKSGGETSGGGAVEDISPNAGDKASAQNESPAKSASKAPIADNKSAPSTESGSDK